MQRQGEGRGQGTRAGRNGDHGSVRKNAGEGRDVVDQVAAGGRERAWVAEGEAPGHRGSGELLNGSQGDVAAAHHGKGGAGTNTQRGCWVHQEAKELRADAIGGRDEDGSVRQQGGGRCVGGTETVGGERAGAGQAPGEWPVHERGIGVDCHGCAASKSLCGAAYQGSKRSRHDADAEVLADAAGARGDGDRGDAGQDCGRQIVDAGTAGGTQATGASQAPGDRTAGKLRCRTQGNANEVIGKHLGGAGAGVHDGGADIDGNGTGEGGVGIGQRGLDGDGGIGGHRCGRRISHAGTAGVAEAADTGELTLHCSGAVQHLGIDCDGGSTTKRVGRAGNQCQRDSAWGCDCVRL